MPPRGSTLFAGLRLWAEEGVPALALELWRQHGGEVVSLPEEATVLVSDNERAPITRQLVTRRYGKFADGRQPRVWASDIVQYWVEEESIITDQSTTRVFQRRAVLDDEEEVDAGAPAEAVRAADGDIVRQILVPRGPATGSVETAPSVHPAADEVAAEVAPLASSANAPRRALHPLLATKHLHRAGQVCPACNPHGTKVRRPRSPTAHHHKRGGVCPACPPVRNPRGPHNRGRYRTLEDLLKRQTSPAGEPLQRPMRSEPWPHSEPREALRTCYAEAPTDVRFVEEEEEEEADVYDHEYLGVLRSRYIHYIERGRGITREFIGRNGFELRRRASPLRSALAVKERGEVDGAVLGRRRTMAPPLWQSEPRRGPASSQWMESQLPPFRPGRSPARTAGAGTKPWPVVSDAGDSRWRRHSLALDEPSWRKRVRRSLDGELERER
eukprot:ctg_277.g110